MRNFVSINEARQSARRRLPRFAYDFIDGGAEDEVALRANREAFERMKFRPNYLQDVSHRDLTTSVCGRTLRFPVILAPTGLARLAGRDGDLAGARAAHRFGAAFTLACMSSHSIEQVAETGHQQLWFQIYLWKDRAVVESLVERAANSRYQALVVTVDVPISAKRERDLRNGFSVPLKPSPRWVVELLLHPSWLAQLTMPIGFRNLDPSVTGVSGRTVALAKYINESLANQAATWDDVKALRELWKGPLLLKGILTSEDAKRALAIGADGLIVSNHGGRQLDGAPATLDVLPEIVSAVEGQADVLVDGGIRRGSDVVKALALGAKACLIGRPWLYGLAAAGEEGVVSILETLKDEIDRTMVLIGRSRIAELDPSAVWIRPDGRSRALD